VISDTSDDGSTFFFHSSSIHNFGNSHPDKDLNEDGISEYDIETPDKVNTNFVLLKKILNLQFILLRKMKRENW